MPMQRRHCRSYVSLLSVCLTNVYIVVQYCVLAAVYMCRLKLSGMMREMHAAE
jgi:hypothetical protein